MSDPTPNVETEGKAARGLFDLRPDDLRDLFESWSEPAYRVKQVFEWAYRRGVGSYADMTNLSKPLRTRLAEELPLYRSKILDRWESRDGAVKLLLGWPDDATTETVLIPDRHRRTACLSTQVGCPVSCAFCASGVGGLTRNLSAGEIVEQAMRIRQLGDEDERLTNVVFMGLGEPLANYHATVRAVRTVNADWGMGIGARKITVSTVGLPTQMRRLAREGLQITLALSLHAPTDELRRKLIPRAKRVSIESLIEAATEYFDHTGREITIEYVLLAGVNDSVSDAQALATITHRLRASVNLIPYNPVESLPFDRPTDRQIDAFADTLRSRSINTLVRRSRGTDVAAACGQLRRRHGSGSENSG